MAEIEYLIKMLQSSDPNKRYEACEELRIKPELTHEALEALRFAANDENADVADAAKRAIELHTGIYPSQEKDLNASPVSTSATSPRAEESSRRNVSTEEQEFIKSKNISLTQNEILKTSAIIGVIGGIATSFFIVMLSPQYDITQSERIIVCFPLFLIVYGGPISSVVILGSILGAYTANYFNKSKDSIVTGSLIGTVLTGACIVIWRIS